MKNLIFCLFGLFFAANTFAQSNFKTYTNTTRGFKVQYPADYAISGASQSDDGRSFTSPDKKTVIYATSGTEAQAEESNINAVYEYYLNEYANLVTYRVLKNNYFVLSGMTDAKTVFYIRCYYSPRTGEYRKLTFDYPKSQSAYFDKLIPKIVASFKEF